MNDKEALKDIVCALIASGDYTFSESDVEWETVIKYGWRVTWFGQVVDHAQSILDRIQDVDYGGENRDEFPRLGFDQQD
jgi:hypothetical protein